MKDINRLERDMLAEATDSNETNINSLRRLYLAQEGFPSTVEGWVAWANDITGLQHTDINDALRAAYKTESFREQFNDVKYDFLFAGGLTRLPKEGLVQWLFGTDFDKDNYTVIDKVGKRDGIIQEGRCYKTDGTNDIIDFERISLGTKHTIKFDAKIPLISDCVVTADDEEIYSAIRIQPSVPRVAYQNISGSAVTFTYTPDSEIHTYELLRDNTSVTLKIDGISIETQTLTNNAALYFNRLFARNPTPEYSDSFSISNLRFYDENNKLTHHWKMDEGARNIAYDSAVHDNKVTNSTFDNTDGWDTSNATISVEDNKLLVIDDGPYSTAYTAIPTIIGQVYEFSYEAVNLVAGIFKSGWGNVPPNGSQYAVHILQSDSNFGYKSYTFTATSSITYLSLGSTGYSTASYKNCKCSIAPINGEIKNANLSTFHDIDNDFNSFQNEEGYTSGIACISNGQAYIESTQAYGEWEFTFNKANNSIPFIFIMSDNKDIQTEDHNGYRVTFNKEEVMYLTKQTTADSTILIETDEGFITAGVNYTIKITRDNTGLFNMFIKGGSFGDEYTLVGTATDNTITTSKYFTADVDVDDIISNLKFNNQNVDVHKFKINDGSFNNIYYPVRTDNMDIFNNKPTYKGRVKYNADLVESNCAEFDGSSYIRFDKEDIDLSRVDYFDFEIKAKKDSSGIINLSQYGDSTNSAGVMWYSNGYISVYAKYDTTSSASYFFNEYDKQASIRAVYDGTLIGNDRVKLYINNSEMPLDYSGTFPETMPGFAQEFRIGRLSSLVSDGKIYNVTRRNRAGEIINNWNFAEGTGDKVYDTVPEHYGDELVTNGNFDDGLNGWVNNDLNTFEIDNGKLHIIGDDSFNKYGGSSIPFYIDNSKKYRFEADVIKNSGTDDWDISLRRIIGGTFLKSITNTETTGKISVDFELDDSGDVYVQFTTRSSFDGVIDNITIKEIISKPAHGTIVDADLALFHAKDNQEYHNLERGFSNILHFNAANDYINIGNDTSLDVTNAITIYSRVKSENFGSSYRSLFIKFKGGRCWALEAHDNKVDFSVSGDGNTWNLVTHLGSVNIADGKVHDIVATYDGTIGKIYVDGVLDESGGSAGSISVETSNATIGANTDVGFMSGLILDSKLWSRALTETEVENITNNIKVSDADLIYDADFKNLTSSTLPDLSGNNNDGVIHGATQLRIPAQSGDTGLDAFGNILTNPSGKFHNGAETKILQHKSPAMIKADKEQLYFFESDETPVSIGYEDMTSNVYDGDNHNITFCDISKKAMYKNLITYNKAQTGDNLVKILKFIHDG